LPPANSFSEGITSLINKKRISVMERGSLDRTGLLIGPIKPGNARSLSRKPLLTGASSIDIGTRASAGVGAVNGARFSGVGDWAKAVPAKPVITIKPERKLSRVMIPSLKNTDQALEVFNNLNGLYALFAKFG
jgi:hypothetical protein